MKQLITLVACCIGLLVFCNYAYDRLETSDGVRYRAEIREYEAEIRKLKVDVANRDTTISAIHSDISNLIENQGWWNTASEDISGLLVYFETDGDGAEEEAQ